MNSGDSNLDLDTLVTTKSLNLLKSSLTLSKEQLKNDTYTPKDIKSKSAEKQNQAQVPKLLLNDQTIQPAISLPSTPQTMRVEYSKANQEKKLQLNPILRPLVENSPRSSELSESSSLIIPESKCLCFTGVFDCLIQFKANKSDEVLTSVQTLLNEFAKAQKIYGLRLQKLSSKDKFTVDKKGGYKLIVKAFQRLGDFYFQSNDYIQTAVVDSLDAVIANQNNNLRSLQEKLLLMMSTLKQSKANYDKNLAQVDKMEKERDNLEDVYKQQLKSGESYEVIIKHEGTYKLAVNQLAQAQSALAESTISLKEETNVFNQK